MKVFITGLLLVSCCCLSTAQRRQFQFPSEMWHEGSVTLTDGNRLEGSVKYDLTRDAVQIVVEEKTLTYSANQIREFRILQEDIQLRRVFFSIPFVTETGYRRPKLFEVLLDGRTSLVAREFIGLSTRTIDNPYYRWGSRFNPIGGRSTQVRFLDYNFYLVSSKGSMELLGSTKKDVLNALKNNQGELKRFIKSNKLKVDVVEDLIAIVRYSNELQAR